MRSTRYRGGGGGGSAPGNSGITDEFSVKIEVPEAIAAQADAATLEIALQQGDNIAAQTETVTAAISGAGMADTNLAPSDARFSASRHWLTNSAGTGVTTPANANGQNDGTLAVVETAVGGTTSETLTADLGNSIPSGISYSLAELFIYFRARMSLTTSRITVTIISNGGLFPDNTIYDRAGAPAFDENFLTVPFSAGDLSAGLPPIDTLAKLQSMRLLFTTQDAAAGVTPARIDLDAAYVELMGVL